MAHPVSTPTHNTDFAAGVKTGDRPKRGAGEKSRGGMKGGNFARNHPASVFLQGLCGVPGSETPRKEKGQKPLWFLAFSVFREVRPERFELPTL